MRLGLRLRPLSARLYRSSPGNERARHEYTSAGGFKPLFARRRTAAPATATATAVSAERVAHQSAAHSLSWATRSSRRADNSRFANDPQLLILLSLWWLLPPEWPAIAPRDNSAPRESKYGYHTLRKHGTLPAVVEFTAAETEDSRQRQLLVSGW